MSSRIARAPITIPSGVEVMLTDKQLKVKGKLGELTRYIHPMVNLIHDGDELKFSPKNGQIASNALAGTMRALSQNMVIGVSQGFESKLVLYGVGYRAKAQGKIIDISAGFSHPVNFELPEGVSAETPSPTEILLKGIDKQLVTQVAANIRALRPPEPYKGKGIRYANEKVILKEVKKK